MNKNYQSLLAEKNTLENMIRETPSDQIINRMSLEARLKSIVKKLGAMPMEDIEPARVRLTFRGKPVVGSHGIFIEFGTIIVSKFNEAITTMAAALFGPLSSVGRIPNRNVNKMIIVNVVPGSFGFELEEHISPDSDASSSLILVQAIEKTQSLLQGLLGSDEELADSLTEDIDKRAILAVKNFLDKMAADEAICSLNFREKTFKFTDVGQVKNCIERLKDENLKQEENIIFTGKFTGVMPKTKKTFEFIINEGNEVISGKISSAITNPEKINSILDQEVNIKVTKTTVGTSKPKYLLIELPSELN